MPASALATTGKASTTEQEAAGIAELLGVGKTPTAPRILLVTSAYHMSRAEMFFRRTGLEVIPFPVDFQTKLGITPRCMKSTAACITGLLAGRSLGVECQNSISIK